MDDDRRELLSRLFAAATEFVETAHEAAVAGQSGALTADGYAKTARRLAAAATDAAALADAAAVVAGLGVERPSGRQNRPR